MPGFENNAPLAISCGNRRIVEALVAVEDEAIDAKTIEGAVKNVVAGPESERPPQDIRST
ncbi:hypothetical protein XH89_28550 [Bradyrhizobium sp. CCBAU 53340]|uniref:hypothetical protein n=1 Tax=Bradyrhizobium sp. CCBAU 53340 TaxID=1325112 RepID=UPI00188D4157|nr:hypothetical protein [Bradyrhizobium sp. CCBAU 53340]QOZ46988.1 hypothetical protein XH89_28550 [Bradyrhizobium sp. CCBAU 53340]